MNKPSVNNIYRTFSLACVAIVNFACTEGTTFQKDNLGYYLDSEVVGVRYSCGNKAGKTGLKGVFKFEKGKGCVFSIGSLVLRTVPASKLSNGVKILEDSPLIAQLLQSLDKDLNRDRIYITKEVYNAVKAYNLSKTFDAYDIKKLVKYLRKKIPNYRGTFVSQPEAISHLAETARGIKNTLAPVVTLVGPSKIVLRVGEEYIESGANCYDDVDKSCEIEITSQVKNDIVGLYNVYYRAKDSNNNTTVFTRSVEVRHALKGKRKFIFSNTLYEAPTIYADKCYSNKIEFTNTRGINISRMKFSTSTNKFERVNQAVDATGYTWINGKWRSAADRNDLEVSISDDDKVAIINDSYFMVLNSIVNVSNKDVMFNQSSGNDIEVEAPVESLKYNFSVQKFKDRYFIHNETRYTSFKRLISKKCFDGLKNRNYIGLITDDNYVKKFAFECGGENNLSGNLVGITEDNFMTKSTIGSWQISYLPGSVKEQVLVIYLSESNSLINKIYALKDGVIWGGSKEIKDLSIDDMNSYYSNNMMEKFEGELADLALSKGLCR